MGKSTQTFLRSWRGWISKLAKLQRSAPTLYLERCDWTLRDLGKPDGPSRHRPGRTQQQERGCDEKLIVVRYRRSGKLCSAHVLKRA